MDSFLSIGTNSVHISKVLRTSSLWLLACHLKLLLFYWKQQMVLNAAKSGANVMVQNAFRRILLWGSYDMMMQPQVFSEVSRIPLDSIISFLFTFNFIYLILPICWFFFMFPSVQVWYYSSVLGPVKNLNIVKKQMLYKNSTEYKQPIQKLISCLQSDISLM